MRKFLYGAVVVCIILLLMFVFGNRDAEKVSYIIPKIEHKKIIYTPDIEKNQKKMYIKLIK